MSLATTMLDLIRKSLNYCGFHVMRSYRIPQNTLNLLDICIAALISQKNTLFFVQIGASDGITDDPLFPLVNKYQLNGICIEPLPDTFEKLKVNYEGFKNIKFENAAITDIDKDICLYRPIDKNNSVSVSQKSSIKKNVLLRSGFPLQKIEKINVKGISFISLVEKYNILDLDILQVDAEGADYEIVKSVLNSGYKPKIINYESLHLNKNDRENIRHLLADKGYSFLETNKDTIAVQNF